VRLYARIALLLGAYLLVGGLIYGGTGKERIGLVLLLVAGGGFAYVGLYARRAVRAADRAPDPVPAASPHVEEVRPTIWPLVFSLAGAGIVAGVLASHWILLAGGVLAVAAAAGWFLEVVARREHH
jgi:Cytochrome c oxidase subunit IV